MTSYERAHQKLVDAEDKLSQALQRLHALRRAALYGQYESAEFDVAVMKYREAEAEVQRAREAYAQAQVAKASIQTSEPNFVPTKRMEFARWLVETGRLSDWESGEVDPRLALAQTRGV